MEWEGVECVVESQTEVPDGVKSQLPEWPRGKGCRKQGESCSPPVVLKIKRLKE